MEIKMGKRKSGGKKIPLELSATPIMGQPETVYDMLNKYGAMADAIFTEVKAGFGQ